MAKRKTKLKARGLVISRAGKPARKKSLSRELTRLQKQRASLEKKQQLQTAIASERKLIIMAKTAKLREAFRAGKSVVIRLRKVKF